MPRDVVVLGTASQAPTAERNHNGCVIRFDGTTILLDPGEGTQRQMLHAGIRSSAIDVIAITHEHGDHCLGLPGVLSRMALDQRRRPVQLVHGASADHMVDPLLALTHAAQHFPIDRIRLPDEGGEVPLDDDLTLQAMPLDHRVPALGYRLQQAPQTRFDGELLAAAGVEGPAVRQLQRDGHLVVGDRAVQLADVARSEPGRAVAFVMDTRDGDRAQAVMQDADLAVVEATFLTGDEDLAHEHGHMTAAQAARAAAAAGVRRLVLTHFSQRYDAGAFLADARDHHPDVVEAEDLLVVAMPETA